MKRIGQLVILSTFSTVVLVGLAGCGQNNEQTAEITGTAPEAADSSDYEAYSRRTTTNAGQGQAGYPGQ